MSTFVKKIDYLFPKLLKNILGLNKTSIPVFSFGRGSTKACSKFHQLAASSQFRQALITIYQILIMKRLVLAFLVVSFLNVQNVVGQAQTLTYGFKSGLSLSKIDGPSEMSGGTALEVNNNANGFFVGALFRYWFTAVSYTHLTLPTICSV